MTQNNQAAHDRIFRDAQYNLLISIWEEVEALT